MERQNEIFLPRKWKEWEIVEKIGSGSYGSVYKVCHADDPQVIAAVKYIEIKVNPHNPHVAGSDAQSIREYYFNVVMDHVFEIRIMEQLKDNPNIVRIYDSVVEEIPDGSGWTIYIMMEFLKDITEMLLKYGEIQEKEVIRLGIDICNALESCAEKNIIHRDVKPENIMVSDTGNYKLGDFGVAKLMEGTSGSASLKGTYSYMAPEIIQMKKYGKRADIYSLGMVLYRFMNRNRDPFIRMDKKLIYYKDREKSLERRLNGEVLPPPVDATEAFAEIILKACEYDPADRYKSISDFKTDLVLLSKGKYHLKRRKNGKNRVYHLSRHQLQMTGLAGLVLLLVLIAGSFLYGKWEDSRYLIRNRSFGNDFVCDLEKNGLLTIRGDGDMEGDLQGDSLEYPWGSDVSMVREVKLEGNITGIGENAFDECENLVFITGTENLTEISDYAFAYCAKLNKIEDLPNLTTVGELAFSECIMLESLGSAGDMEKLQVIKQSAFEDCSLLKTVEGLKNVVEIGEYAFSDCKNLIFDSRELDPSCKIGEGAFENCPEVIPR